MFNQRFYGTAIVALALLASACGGGADEVEAPAAEATPTLTVDPSEAATITGKVTFSGTAPKAVRIRMDQEPNCAGQHAEAFYRHLVEVDENGGLGNVFVWVKEGLGDYTFETPAEPVVIDQKGCIYTPHVVGVQTRQDVKIQNSDPTTHNIHPLPRQNREWNRSQSPGSSPLVRSFPRQEVMIPVKCNIHPWMKTYIGVVSHPYFAVTSGDGTFEIRGLPPGEYMIEAWQEKRGTLEQKVTVGPQESKAIEFAFQG
jgi:hypothetical protein